MLASVTSKDKEISVVIRCVALVQSEEVIPVGYSGENQREEHDLMWYLLAGMKALMLAFTQEQSLDMHF